MTDMVNCSILEHGLAHEVGHINKEYPNYDTAPSMRDQFDCWLSSNIAL
jgi:hypothetical protein